MKTFILILIVTLCLELSQSIKEPIVKTQLGGIKGHCKISKNGRDYEAFEGIPFAMPPIGKLRFKPPEKISPWTGDLLATKLAPNCLHYTYHVPSYEKIDGSEDCLYLNIYKPKNVSSTLLPVIIWIHGGYFIFGGAKIYGPDYLMDRDVIFVSINYRLGPLGFLSTEDEVVPGNMGLKDQVMAIKWVNENIISFGGNPKKITLIGHSAGGASVHYHYLSPMSAGLFSGGISISGTVLAPWAQAKGSSRNAKKLGALVGCPTKKNREMVDCLQKRPASAIVGVVENFVQFFNQFNSPFGPVVEKTNNEAFIDRSPVNILESGDVQDLPWMTGITSEESLTHFSGFINDNERLKILDKNWDKMAPHLLYYNDTLPTSEQAEVSQKARKHYLGTKPIEKSTLRKVVNLISDRLYIVDAEKAARMQAKVNKNPVWFYYFSYRGEHSFTEILTQSKENFGVAHGDDILYFIKFMDLAITKENDVKMQQDILDLGVTFAKKGVPELKRKWLPVDSYEDEFRYFEISGPKQFQMRKNANFGDKSFWNSIDFNENRIEWN